MDNPLGPILRIRRIVYLTIVGLVVWPVALFMVWAYPEERKYWLGVLGVNVILAVIVFVYLGIKKGMFG